MTEATNLLATGGWITTAGSPAALETWATSAAKASGRQLVRLDLEGWEPASSSPRALNIQSFLRYRSVLWGEQPDEQTGDLDAHELEGQADGPVDGHVEIQPEPGPLGLFEVASLSLFGSAGRAQDREGLIGELGARSAETPLLVLLADGDTVPAPLQRALRQAADGAGERLAIVDGTRGQRAHAERLDVVIEPGASPTVEDMAVEDLFARRVFEALAILGRPFPLELLLELLVPDAARHEDTIDLVDDDLVDERELVEDLGFVHPFFENSVYRLADPLAEQRILESVDVAPRAEALLSFLRQRLNPRARLTTSALLRLAELCGRDEQARRLRLRLAWWAADDDMEDDLLAAAQAGEVSQGELLSLGADGVLSAETRLAVHRVHEEIKVSPESEGLFWLHHTRALRDSGDTAEALEAIGRSLEWHRQHSGEQTEAFLETQLTAARLLAEVGEPREARDQLQFARQLASEILDPKDPRHAVLAAEHGRILAAVGELRSAREPLEEALERTEQRFGENHPQTVSSRNNLAVLLTDIGELESAREHFLRAIRAAKTARMPAPLRIGLWGHLHTAEARLGGGEAIARLLDGVRTQIESAAQTGPFASLAGSVPLEALGDLERMLGIGPSFGLEEFEVAEDALLQELD